MASTVHIVHCVDTEGPLHEPVQATFQRLKTIFGLDLPATRDTLARLQRQELPLGGLEAEVARVVAPELLAYNDGWDKIDAMLARIMAPGFRDAMPDSFGGGWVYTWFCLDHVGFADNPRRRDMGMHNVFDHYRQAVVEWPSPRDEFGFHHHPIPFSRQASHCATHYFSHAPVVFDILARRILDRLWFPATVRPGLNVVRPDSAWLFEQHFPFEFSNQNSGDEAAAQRDLAAGRFGDWRRAPASWVPYHPSHDDYQVPGGCRRWTARCLNVGTRHRLMTQEHVDQAFAEARDGKPVVLSFTDHDWRDMTRDIDAVRAMVASASARFPGVPFKWCGAREAMRGALGLPEAPPPEPALDLADGRLAVRSDRPIFGPQPFLALRTRDGRVFHDNLDFQVPAREWSYSLDEHTFPPAAVAELGVAVTDAAGGVAVAVLDVASGQVRRANP